tara:strand:+ start:650 stop:1237 length:588 start_codon:yes stop_codon:yes gene_type:complete
MDYIFSNINDFIIFTNDNLFISIFIFFIFFSLASSISLPGLSVFVALSGYLYGIYLGYLVIIFGLTLGSFVFFIMSKIFLSKLLPKYYSKYSKNLSNYIKESSFEYLIIFRMIPGPPLLLQNILLSILNISYLKFIISSFIGLTPLNLAVVYIGNKINNIQSIKNISFSDIITLDVLIIISLLILVIGIRIKFKK